LKELLTDIIAGSGPIPPFLALLVLGAFVFLVASRLAHDADAIAEETGWGGLWIGSLLLAAATSLPELLTDVNSVFLKVPDIGAGDLFGSSMANMMILASVNLIFIRRHVFKNAVSEHALVGLLAIVLTLFAGLGILAGGLGWIGHVGVGSILILVIYVGAMRALWRSTAPETASSKSGKRVVNHRRLRRSWIVFGLSTLALVFLAPALVVSAEIFAHESGLSTTFVGTLIIGLTTSFPEMSAVFAAVRLGAYDLAVGDIFGSNAFNMTIFVAMDLFYLDGPLLPALSVAHVVTALLAVLAMALGIFAVLYRNPRQEGPAWAESVLILAVYFGGMILLSTFIPR
jgi:cation:H+ antiporter